MRGDNDLIKKSEEESNGKNVLQSNCERPSRSPGIGSLTTYRSVYANQLRSMCDPATAADSGAYYVIVIGRCSHVVTEYTVVCRQGWELPGFHRRPFRIYKHWWLYDWLSLFFLFDSKQTTAAYGSVRCSHNTRDCFTMMTLSSGTLRFSGC